MTTIKNQTITPNSLISLGDGDTLENVVIDYTNTNSNPDRIVYANGDGWTIRNVAVVGATRTTNGGGYVFALNGNGTFENVWMGDGNGSDGQHSSGRMTGIFVPRSHSGEITIARTRIHGFPDNGIYASAPGNGSEHPAPGSGGKVRVINSKVTSCGSSAIRLGTDGSYAKNCVSQSSKAFWGYYEDTKAINCDLDGAIYSGESAWSKGASATVTLENCRVNGPLDYGPGTTHGGNAGSPNISRTPSGCPTSPEDAASDAPNSSPDTVIADGGTGGTDHHETTSHAHGDSSGGGGHGHGGSSGGGHGHGNNDSGSTVSAGLPGVGFIEDLGGWIADELGNLEWWEALLIVGALVFGAFVFSQILGNILAGAIRGASQ